eukprot:1761312-Rhodomonas_salina.1
MSGGPSAQRSRSCGEELLDVGEELVGRRARCGGCVEVVGSLAEGGAVLGGGEAQRELEAPDLDQP